jgi:hypothetical protein
MPLSYGMLLDRRTVSRKTSLDGKLEIAATAAAHLEPFGPDLTIHTGAGDDTARLSSMTCTCAKGGGSGHVHHFLESPILKRLREGEGVVVRWDGETSIVSVDSE